MRLTKTQIRSAAKDAVANHGPYAILDSGTRRCFDGYLPDVAGVPCDQVSEADWDALDEEGNRQAERVLVFLGL
jgi:hypothetical protein